MAMTDPSGDDGGTTPPDLATPVDMALPPAEGKPLWGRSYGANIGDVAAAADGSIFVAGTFSRADLGDGMVTSKGSSDGFLIKFDKVGQRLWTRTFGRNYADVPTRLAVDAAGNVAVVGYSLRADGTGTHDAFVTYYDPAGSQKYFTTYGGPLATAVDVATAVAFGQDGSLYVTGGFEDRINFGGGDLVSAGDRDLYLLKLNAAGAHVFSKRWGFTSYDQTHALAVFPDGDVLFVGTGGYPIDFGDGKVGEDPDANAFVVRLSPQGAARFAKRYRIALSSTLATATAPDGTFWLGGDTSRPLDLGGGARTSPTGRALFAGHLSATGEHIASYLMPTSGSAYATTMAVDATGQIILGGAGDSDIDFGLGTTKADAGYCFFFKLAPGGPLRWARRFGGTAALYSNRVQGVAVTPTGQVLAAGDVSQNVTVGSVSLSPWGFLLTVSP